MTQQAALETRLAAAFSIYEYVQSYLQVEYNIGGFSMLRSEAENQDFENRLEQYLINEE